MSKRTSVPVKYAHKEEGRDVDDGLEDYEATEQQLAQETLQHLEQGVVEADFDIGGLGAASKKATAVKAVGRELATRVSQGLEGGVPKEVLALLQEMQNQLSQLVTPSTPQQVRDTVLRLKFCMYIQFLLLLYVEGKSYEDHPVLDAINDILPTVQALKAVEAPKKKDRRRRRSQVEEEDGVDTAEGTEDGHRSKITTEMLNNRGLTRTRPKDRKNPRLNQKRKYKRGVRKVRSIVRQHKPEGSGGFQGVGSLRPHVTKSMSLS